MRNLALLATAAVVGVGLGACRHASQAGIDTCGKSEVAAPAPSSPLPTRPFVAVVQRTPASSAMLARFGPVSLRRLSPQIEIGEYHRTWSISPDGRQLALGVSAGSASATQPPRPLRRRIGIYIVDLETMKLVGELQTGVAAVAVEWLGPRLLAAALQRGGTVFLDPRTGRIVRRWRAFSFPDASAPARDGLVLLFPKVREAGASAPLIRVSGPPRLAIVDAGGRLQSVTLKRIQLGIAEIAGTFYEDRAALAVDPVRGRAYVAAADGPVAEVALRTMRVTYHEVPRPATEDEGVVRARQRRALWLGGDKLAVFGVNLGAAENDPFAAAPAGVFVIDTADWNACVLDAKAGGAAVAAGQLMTYAGTRATAADANQRGLRGYSRGSRDAWQVLDDRHVWDVDIVGAYAYARTERALYVVDTTSRRILATVARPLEVVDVIHGAR
jgi:hypothetical protein